MTISFYTQDLPWLKKTYFSHPERRLTLKKGDILVRQGGYNDRLYLILSGTLAAYVANPDGKEFKLFEASKNMFAGVYSFFSRTFTSLATVVAEDTCSLAYITRDQAVMDKSRGTSLFEQFMSVVVTNLAHRQQHEQQIAFEKERMLKKLVQSKKMASLGQMAAGISHELNNAISVLDRNTQWLSLRMEDILESPEQKKYFKQGLRQGRVSSRALRKQSRRFARMLSLDEETARKAAEVQLQARDRKKLPPQTIKKDVSRIHRYWELGATFHDMKIASGLASSVVRSVKALASHQAERKPGIDVNNSIKEALSLLGSPLRKVDLTLNLKESLSLMTAAPGELVQVWTNLIRNAVESMAAADQEKRRLFIQSKYGQGFIWVSIIDNGPGIPSQIFPKIFQPNFTTKEKGLEFGLGLGLTIVERLVSEYGGDITAKSKPGRTEFTVKLPVEG